MRKREKLCSSHQKLFMRKVVDYSPWRQTAWVLIAALILAGYMTLGKEVHSAFLCPLSPICKMDTVVVAVHSKDFYEE